MSQHSKVRDRVLELAINRAWAAEQNGKLDIAGSLAERILREYPGNTEARFIQARIWARTGKLNSAIPVFEQLLREDPGFDAARLALVGALFLVNAYNEGIDHGRFLIGECLNETEVPPEVASIMQSLWNSYQSRDEQAEDKAIYGED